MRGSSRWSLAFGLLLSAYAETEKRSHAAYILADADRDMLTGGPDKLCPQYAGSRVVAERGRAWRGYSSN